MSTEHELRQDRDRLQKALERCQRLIEMLEEKDKTIEQQRAALKASDELADKLAQEVARLSLELEEKTQG